MDKGAAKEPVTSTPAWDELEEWTRGRIQEWMQQLLVEEVTEFLGRAKHQRRGVDMQGYRNGYGKPRRLTMRSGTVTVRRPRVRDLDERFESRLLPLFTRRTQEVTDLLPELYLHGLASGDVETAASALDRLRALADELPTPDLEDRIQEQHAGTQHTGRLLCQAYRERDEQERRGREAKREPPKPKGSSVPRAIVADEFVSAEAVAAYARIMYRCGQAAFSLTLAEIGAVIGCQSRRASALLAELEQAGYLEKRP